MVPAAFTGLTRNVTGCTQYSIYQRVRVSSADSGARIYLYHDRYEERSLGVFELPTEDEEEEPEIDEKNTSRRERIGGF